MQFKMEAFHNPYLTVGVQRVDAILTLTAEGTAVNASTSLVGLIVDTSGSMEGDRINAVKFATRKVIQLLPPETWFFLVGFSDSPHLIYPPSPATDAHKAAADAQVRRIEAGGRTCMSRALLMARE